jgi:ABC-2 type transport system permease protein
MSRVTALVAKELADLRRNPGVFVPAAITGVASLLVPIFVALNVPVITGERLSDSSDFQIAAEMFRLEPATVGLSADGAIQAWIFQQFLIMLVLTPVAAAMSVAAFSVVGEKQARTLEPLLATPITTVELLTGKVLGAAIPALALGFGVFAVYAIGIAVFAEAGVWRVLFLPRSLAVTFLLGPLASLASLQLAVCVSSRANDPRSAQQIGVLILLPIAGLLAAQLLGSLQLTLAISALIAVGLTIVNLALMVLGVRVFDRESILTRWR